MNVILADASVALRAVLERSVVASVGFFANETWLEHCIDAMGTFSADKNDVSVRFELCVVIRAKAAQFLFDLTSNLFEVLRQILCKITAKPTKDGVMQSVTIVDVHRVRRTTLPRNGNVRRDSDDVFVWEHEGLLLVNFRSRFEFCVVVESNVAQFLFDILSNLLLSSGGERVLAE